MIPLYKHIAELSMIRAIPLTADDLPKGRIRGLLVMRDNWVITAFFKRN